MVIIILQGDVSESRGIEMEGGEEGEREGHSKMRRGRKSKKEKKSEDSPKNETLEVSFTTVSNRKKENMSIQAREPFNMPLTKREQFGFSLKNLQAEAKGDCMELLCCTSKQERRRKILEAIARKDMA